MAGYPKSCVDRQGTYPCVINTVGGYECAPVADGSPALRNKNATTDKRGVLRLDVPSGARMRRRRSRGRGAIRTRRLHQPLDARREAAQGANPRPSGTIAPLPRRVFPRLGVHVPEVSAPLLLRRPTRSILWANDGLQPSRCGHRLWVVGVDELWSIRNLTAVVAATAARSRQGVFANTRPRQS
jgi:hypothetical protein